MSGSPPEGQHILPAENGQKRSAFVNHDPAFPLAGSIKKAIICSGILLFFLLFTYYAQATPIDPPQQLYPLQEQNWNQLGKTILHRIAGDDFQAFFGFEPRITIIRNPLPMALLASEQELFFSSGLLKLIDSQDAYAFLIAHEIAHALLEHPKSHNHALHWNLKEEAAADILAIRLIHEAGFSPMKATKVLEHIASFGQESGLGLHALYPTLRARKKLLSKSLPLISVS